jgi:hypothetical protein
MMRRRFSLSLSLAAILLLVNNSFGEKTRVAVCEFTGQGVDQATALQVSERLAAWLAEMPSFEVITPSRVHVLLKERGFENSCKDDDTACLAKMGVTIGADAVIAGIFAKAENIHTILIRVVDVATGTVLTTGYQDISDPVDKIISDWTAKAAKQLETVINTKMWNYGAIKIKSVPKGASVIIDGNEVGKTDLAIGHHLPGKFSLEIALPSYVAVKETITVEPRKTVDLSFQLRHTKVFADSTNSALMKRVVVRSVLGCLVVGCGAAGYYYNHRAVIAIQEEGDAKNSYLSAMANSDFNGLYQQYKDAEKKTDRTVLMRNILYSLTGACTVGLVVSFFF